MVGLIKSKTVSALHIILVLLFCATLNVVNRYYFFLFFAVGFLLFNPKRKFSGDFISIFSLLVLGAAWMAFSPTSTDSVFGVMKPFTYILCYLMGRSLICDAEKRYGDEGTEKFLNVLLIALAGGAFAHYILNWLKNGNANERNTVDIWTGEIMAATGQASLACLALGFAVALIFSNSSKKTKFISGLVLLLVMGYNLVLSGRTLLMMLLIIATVAFVHQFIKQKNGQISFLVGIAIVILVLIFAYRANVFGVRTFVESSGLYNRFFSADASMGLDEDGRWDKKVFFLNNMLDYPWGGMNMFEVKGYAHDIFLDTYDEAGIFALVGMVIYILSTIHHMLKCFFDNTLSFEVRQIVLCVYIVCYIEFMVEPILQGMPWLFASFCLIDGYVGGIISSKRAVTIKGVVTE